MEPGRRETSGREVPPEAPVERAARDPGRSRARLPQRLARVHRRQLLASVGQGQADRLVGGGGELPSTTLATLAPVGVEDRLALDADVPYPQADRLGASSSGEHQDKEDRPIS